MVRDRIILHALNEAYRNILPAGIFPVVLLFVEMPLREVDVNVHPSKTEVRFRHQALLHDFLRDSVRKALMEARPQTPFPAARHAQSALGDNPFDSPPTEELGFPGAVPRASSWSAAASAVRRGRIARKISALTSTNSGSNQCQAPFPKRERPDHFEQPLSRRRSFGESLAIARVRPPAAALSTSSVAMPAGAPTTGESGEPVLVAQSQFGIVPLGQIDNSFIVAADGGALLLIDQHVAHETDSV